MHARGSSSRAASTAATALLRAHAPGVASASAGDTRRRRTRRPPLHVLVVDETAAVQQLLHRLESNHCVRFLRDAVPADTAADGAGGRAGDHASDVAWRARRLESVIATALTRPPDDAEADAAVPPRSSPLLLVVSADHGVLDEIDVLAAIPPRDARADVEHEARAARSPGAAKPRVPRAPDGRTLPEDCLVVRDGAWTRLVPIRDLLWLESYGNYTRVCTAGRQRLHRATLAAVARQLAPYGFTRIHRRLLVNVARVVALRPARNGAYEACLDSGHRLRVSRSCRAALLERIATAFRRHPEA